MQELTLKELQKACLEILIDFHASCVSTKSCGRLL